MRRKKKTIGAMDEAAVREGPESKPPKGTQGQRKKEDKSTPRTNRGKEGKKKNSSPKRKGAK